MFAANGLFNQRSRFDPNYMRDRGVFLNTRSMDNLFLNRMNSRQGIIKKKQETIF